ncbi:hypothetical protein CLORY_45700 [Clostridium oryzae]|uniref:Uncharacterized protein n=1 Tax=Clostridium oryzae TaxID=1450648 RepID=A0A1V4I3J5_9CLOT|nr:hypothetical protein CLORY_45700 [Clostridium oryzae]
MRKREEFIVARDLQNKKYTGMPLGNMKIKSYSNMRNN